jgi:nicotinamidase-related amidase
MPVVRSPLRLDTARSALWVIDLQEKLCPAIPSADNVIRQTHRLLQAARELSVPFAATVQYPSGLGPLVPSLSEYFPSPEVKRDFSATVCRDSLDRWFEQGRDQIVVVGVETHVCVLQTVLDLIAEGARPYIVAEAVASRNGRDHETAMQRMSDSGATLVTVESVLFEWLGTSDRPEFKAISQLVKSGSERPRAPSRA